MSQSEWMQTVQNEQIWLHEVSSGRMTQDEWFFHMAKNGTPLRTLTLATEPGGSEKPVLAPGATPENKRLVLVMDPEALQAIRLQTPGSPRLMAESAWTLVPKTLRAGHDGFVVNPGHPTRMALDRTAAARLWREYAVAQLARKGGGWVPVRDEQMLLVEYAKDTYTVAVYATEEDCEQISRQCGGTTTFMPWSRIARRCQEVGAEAPFLQFGYPEQVMLESRHMEVLTRQSGDSPPSQQTPSPTATPSAPASSQGHDVQAESTASAQAGLQALEQAIRQGQGIANGWEVCRALAELQSVWVIVDSQGELVPLTQDGGQLMIDLFTSEAHALALLEDWKQKHPDMPPLIPRLVPARPLFETWAPKTPVVWINRGTPQAWTSVTGETLPYVLQLSGS
ncbi:hypothetical protein JQC72_04480 [Polycladomyces sp. WAk]|uniref:SseB protein N-terminal domain-containing protein n=1 Tax=Polycladomyces zharkentensis TaxID=2807616 RepID=A0ABS2WGY9_9BACL|nr:hypothetical protein [Polycladomyces sp. WAk]MBN2908778.1 hypothetical protein [Polycladomyces sp. WAk]